VEFTQTIEKISEIQRKQDDEQQKQLITLIEISATKSAEVQAQLGKISDHVDMLSRR